MAAPLIFALEPKNTPSQHLLQTSLSFSPQPLHFSSYRDLYGNRIWRVMADQGSLRLRHESITEVSPNPDAVHHRLRKVPVQDLPNAVLHYTLPSRYCPSDLLTTTAWERFGGFEDGWPQVQAVCDWLHENVRYQAGSGSGTSALEALERGEAVCRDFAHLGVSFCRALSLPARYVSGYLPEIGVTPDGLPMDFHAWFEVYLGSGWHTFDARHNTPRTGRVVVAKGRDAADVAFSTTYGATRLETLEVWAEAL
ncbi:MAG: transglutaminase family protein [Meiothermus sp.]|nr:transglutaminase family protein [Meiothermus sp.]